MSSYKSGFPFKIAFPPQKMDNVLAEWLAKQGLTQCHIAGKLDLQYAHNPYIMSFKKPRNMLMSLSSSMVASNANSREKSAI